MSMRDNCLINKRKEEEKRLDWIIDQKKTKKRREKRLTLMCDAPDRRKKKENYSPIGYSPDEDDDVIED